MRQHPSQSPALVDHTHAKTPLNAVDTAAIQDGAVTTAKIADGTILSTDLNASAFGTVGQITAIDPDDAAAAGATGKVADAGHQHPATANAPADLTRTTASSEGAGPGIARDTHVHSTAALSWGLLAAPTALTADSGTTSGTTELDLALDITATQTAGRRVRLTFSFRNILGSIAADEFEVRFKENSTQVAAFRGQVHETTAKVDLGTCVHTYVPTAGSRTFEVFLVRVTGTGNAKVVAGATFPATFTVEDVG